MKRVAITETRAQKVNHSILNLREVDMQIRCVMRTTEVHFPFPPRLLPLLWVVASTRNIASFMHSTSIMMRRAAKYRKNTQF